MSLGFFETVFTYTFYIQFSCIFYVKGGELQLMLLVYKNVSSVNGKMMTWV